MVYLICHACMQGIVEAIPELLGTIQAQLLDLLSLVLAGRPYRDSMHPPHLAAYHAAVTHGEIPNCSQTAPVPLLMASIFPRGVYQGRHFMTTMSAPVQKTACCYVEHVAAVPSSTMAGSVVTGHTRFLCAGELQGAALTRLALQTLGSFDFGSMRLLDFVRDHVTLFLDDPDVSVRRAAAAAAAKVLHRAASLPPGSHGSITQNQVKQLHLCCLNCLHEASPLVCAPLYPT